MTQAWARTCRETPRILGFPACFSSRRLCLEASFGDKQGGPCRAAVAPGLWG